MVETDEGPAILRSYDHDPRLLDAVILRSNWGGVSSLVVTDCLWGALDGINEHGLAIALAFGGRNVIGRGVAARLICRYILQTCATVNDAREALARLPVYMPYTFAVLDATGDFVTAFLGPDADAVFVKRRTSTNHQSHIEWPEYARFVETIERLALVEGLTEDPISITRARKAFLSPPVWRSHYAKGSGTLYVAEYSPTKKSLDLYWPDQTKTLNLDDNNECTFTAVLPDTAVK
jgi:predicted choloylglycine hydrolase